MYAEIGRQLLRAGLIGDICRHQYVSDGDTQSPITKELDAFYRPLKRMRQLGNRIMDRGPMRVEADLNRVDIQIPQARGLVLADHDRIRFDLDVEKQPPRMFKNLEKVSAHKNFAAAEREKKD